jgi:hypothetical protein
MVVALEHLQPILPCIKASLSTKEERRKEEGGNNVKLSLQGVCSKLPAQITQQEEKVCTKEIPTRIPEA